MATLTLMLALLQPVVGLLPPPSAPPFAPGIASIDFVREALDSLNAAVPPVAPPSPPQPPLTPPGPQAPPFQPPGPPPQPPVPSVPPLPPRPPSEPPPSAPPPESSTAAELVLESGMTYPLSEPLVVRGEGIEVSIVTSGSAPAILDGQHLSKHFIVTDGARLTLRNLHLVNGYQPCGMPPGYPFGSDCSDSRAVVANGGSIDVRGQGTVLRLFGVHVKHNLIEGDGFFCACRGGGVHAIDGAVVNISGATFLNNTATLGHGGCLMAANSAFHVTGSTFEDCFAGALGGGVSLQPDYPTGDNAFESVFADSTFVNCHAGAHGGALNALASRIRCEGVDILRCQTTSLEGGSIHVVAGWWWASTRSAITMTDVLIEEGSTGANGGGLAAWELTGGAAHSNTVRLLRVIFRGCTASTGGGAWIYNCDAELEEVTFDSCQANEGGGVVLRTTPDNLPVRITNGNFSRCHASGAMPSGGGGLFLREGAVAIIEDTIFIECTTAGRGGAAASTPELTNTLTLLRATILRCRAPDHGGGLKLFGDLTLIDTHVLECSSVRAKPHEPAPPTTRTCAAPSEHPRCPPYPIPTSPIPTPHPPCSRLHVSSGSAWAEACIASRHFRCA